MNSINYIAYRTIARREVVRILRIWIQTFLPPVITTTLYFLIFGGLMGSRIGSIEGFSYIQFIAPGLIMMPLITNAYSNVSSSFFSAKFQRSYEEMIVAPVGNAYILLGYMTGGIFRGLLIGVAIAIIASFFTTLHVYHALLIIIVAVLATALFSIAGFINSLMAKKFDDVTIIPTFVLTPLTYLGGVFYSIKMLPDFWQKLSLFNPIVYIINAFRYAMLGKSDVNIYVSLGIIALFTVGLFMFTLSLLNNGYGIRK